MSDDLLALAERGVSAKRIAIILDYPDHKAVLRDAHSRGFYFRWARRRAIAAAVAAGVATTADLCRRFECSRVSMRMTLQRMREAKIVEPFGRMPAAGHGGMPATLWRCTDSGEFRDA